MRLFIATPVNLPNYKIIKNALEPFLEGNWVKGFNLHLTHLFIGEGKIEDFKFKLQIPNEKIKISGFGMFGQKILYINAHSKNIDTINKQLTKITGIKSNFKAHITICRIKKINNFKDFSAKLKELEGFEFYIDFKVFLYSSTLTPKGPIYKKEYQY
jgi:2'-5' RNA ligase